MKNDLKLDIFPHIFPQAFFGRMKRIAEANPALAASIKRWLNIPVLWDLDARIRMMGKFKGYQQILTLSLPAIEYLGGPEESPALARLANDGMAEIVTAHPDRFPAFVASLPMNNVPAALEEMERAIAKLGAKGIQLFTNVNGRPLDDPEFYPVFERCVKKYDLPIWLHPVRTVKFADYPSKASRSTRSGGCSAGPTRLAPAWRASCSRACCRGCRVSRSSRITSARWRRTSTSVSVSAWTRWARALPTRTMAPC